MILNTAAAPLDDPQVRQALAYAIDREQIVDVLLDGSVPVLQSVVRPAQLGHTPAFDGYAHDPERAIALLEQAGWTRGDDGVFEKDGRDLRIPVAYSSESELRRLTARLMVEQAAAAGIRLGGRRWSAPCRADRHGACVLRRGAPSSRRWRVPLDVEHRPGARGTLPYTPLGDDDLRRCTG